MAMRGLAGPMAERVDAALFEEGLGRICLGRRPALPRNRRDRAILLCSAVLGLNTTTVYSELEINLAWQDWRRLVAPDLGADHVQIRRALVDEGFLGRTRDGQAYEVLAAGAARAFTFDEAVAKLDASATVAARRGAIAAQKAAHLARQRSGQ